jgi:predicted transcriptional regulator
MRRQFVLDEKANRLLEELAADRAGNRSLVVREAIQLYAALESSLEEVESEAGFQRLMERSAADIRAGRVCTHAQVKGRLKTAKRKK